MHRLTLDRMLYEFHRNENKKKASSVHATYLVAGSRYETQPSNGVITDGDDVVMASSQPFPSSPPEITINDVEDDTPILSITLVREEDLKEARQSYESISAIHVYSLGPTKVKDLQILSDANREVVEKYAGQNGTEYGTITNKNVRKRTVGGPRLASASLPAPAKAKPAAVNKEEAKKPEPAKTVEAPSATGVQKEPALKAKSSSTNFFTQPSNAAKKDSKSATPAEPEAAKSAALKRGVSGSIFASFAKAKPKASSESSAASSAAQSPASTPVPDDEPMKDVSDDEEEEYVAPPPKPRAKKEAVKKETAAEKKKRIENEEMLKRMMDEESDEDPKRSKSATPAVVEDEEEEVEEVAPPKKEKPEPKEYVEISGGRRRGKRRVMKKKTMRDEEGYLGMLLRSSLLCMKLTYV